MGESSLNDLFYFDIETKTWTQIPGNDTFPAERSFHQMVSVGDNLFVFGGCGKSGRLSDLHEFDTATSKWIKHSNVILSTDISIQFMNFCKYLVLCIAKLLFSLIFIGVQIGGFKREYWKNKWKGWCYFDCCSKWR